MSRSSLRRRLQEYYRGKRMPERKRASLCTLLTAELPSVSPGGRIRRPLAWGAAAIVLVSALVVYLVPDAASPRAEGHRRPSAQDIAREVAANHTRDLQAEFRRADYAGLRRSMTKLDFSIIEPRLLPAGDLRVVGARYCSVQCAVAVQVKLKDRRSESHTLYQVADHDRFSHIDATAIWVGGVRVRIWREQGLLLCLAGPGR